ncbi:MAG TPA: YetF domain-containing protein [Deinococcales bacterium]|nr:YetF domain-containing protein [Deinococcales bacterium]
MDLSGLGAFLDGFLGINLDPDELGAWQMAARAAVVFLIALALIRIGPGRLLGGHSAFDMVMALIIGSVLSRAVNGDAPVGTTLVASLVLFGMHWLFSMAAYKWHAVGQLVKGSEVVLVRDGKIQPRGLLLTGFSERDLRSAVRQQLRQDSLEGVLEARMERSGDVSLITARREPRVVEVRVEAGVQTVRVELDG